MTPSDFAATYRPTADQVAAGTGIDPIALLSQWAAETAWGSVVVGNNLGNIRCSPTAFCQYATLNDFAIACIATFHNGLFGPVLAATNAVDQLNAIVASPWSAGHYGGSLAAFYQPLEAFELTPDEHTTLTRIYQAIFFPPDPTNPYAGSLVQLAKAAALDAVKAAVEKPKTITLHIPSVPGDATGTSS